MKAPLSPSHSRDAVAFKFSPEPIANSVVFYGVTALLLLGPLAFGAVEPWSMWLLESGSTVLFLIWALRETFSPAFGVRWNSLFTPMLVFAVLILVQLVGGKTFYRYATLTTGLLYGAYGMLCFLAVQSVRSTAKIKILVRIFSGYGMALATFALVQGLSSNGKLYWLRTPRGGGWIYGPYVNHNHYAGLMEMLFPVPLVFALTTHVQGRMRALAVLASAVMATTIFLSQSRGGMLAFAGEIILLVAALMWHRNRIPRRGKAALALFAIASFLLLAWIGGYKTAERLGNIQSARNEISDGLRTQIDRDLLRMAPHRPILGWGLGTFAYVYPHYRSFYTTLYLDEAHNDYLQLLIEMGAAGFATMIWFLALTFRGASKKLRIWTTDIHGALALAAVVGICGILIHSLVDFNLQIPANAALFYVFCTLAAMRPDLNGADERIHPPHI